MQHVSSALQHLDHGKVMILARRAFPILVSTVSSLLEWTLMHSTCEGGGGGGLGTVVGKERRIDY